jgi:hypothetical protein
VIAFKNWPINQRAAKLVIAALMIRLAMVAWSALQWWLLGIGMRNAIPGGALVMPGLASLLEAAVLALLVYAVFLGRPGARVWPLGSR